MVNYAQPTSEELEHNPNQRTFTDDGITFEWCTSDNGIHIIGHRTLGWILDALYDAFNAAFSAGQTMLEVLYLSIGAESAYQIVNNWVVQDFRITTLDEETGIREVQKYWAIKLEIGTDSSLIHINTTIPLLKIALPVNFWLRILAPLDVPLPGSELWFYDKGDGTYQVGTEFTPTRQFYLLTDGGETIKKIGLVLGITFLLQRIGLLDVAFKFAKFVFTKYRNWRRSRIPKETLEVVEDIYDEVIELDGDLSTSVAALQSVLSTHTTVLQTLVNAIGLRLTL